MNLLEAWEIYYQDKKLEGYSDVTLKGYKLQTLLLTRYFEDKDINEINIFDLKQYLTERGFTFKIIFFRC